MVSAQVKRGGKQASECRKGGFAGSVVGFWFAVVREGDERTYPLKNVIYQQLTSSQHIQLTIIQRIKHHQINHYITSGIEAGVISGGAERVHSARLERKEQKQINNRNKRGVIAEHTSVDHKIIFCTQTNVSRRLSRTRVTENEA